MPAVIIKPDKEVSVDGEHLLSEIHSLMLESIGYRVDCGANCDIQNAYLRASQNFDQPNSIPWYPAEPENEATEEKSCSCGEGKTCSICDPDLKQICSTDEIAAAMEKTSPFKSLARHLCTIKQYDYTSLVEHAYAKTGNKPFKLKSNREITINPDEMDELAGLLEANIEAFIEANDVRVDEIPEAFNFSAMSDLVVSFEDFLKKKAERHNTEQLERLEESIERTFNRTNFMEEYVEVIKDTANYPIGIMWFDDTAIRKEKRVTSSGRIVIEQKIQAIAERVHPSEVWFTPDFSFSKVGRAVFRVKRFTRGDIARWKDMHVAGSDKLESNINKFLDKYDEGCYIPYTMLFRNLNPIVNYDYDIVITRGLFTKEYVRQTGIEIPASMKHESFIPCEVYFAGSYVLRARVMDVLDKHLGVFTTVFRRNCDSIYGYSVYDFCFPFAKLYANTVDSVDKSVGKAVGMFIQVDRSVIDDPDKYFRRDENGQIVLDISEDQLIEFDSTQAFGAPNFKGFPITVTELPSNLEKLTPLLGLIVQEMERITKIPNMLTDGADVSSALRTTSNMNMAYNSSAKVVQALLREAENRILRPGIKYMFDCEVLGGRVPTGLLELDPEILLSDTLVRENNDGRELVASLQVLGQYRDIIPPDKFNQLLNTIARTVLGFREDIIPDVGVFNIERKPQEQTVV